MCLRSCFGCWVLEADHLRQSDRHLWRINGVRPPTIKEPEQLKEWIAAGKPVV